uniref:TLC domain-containing protein n=1 Tax=Plectus sambesii TaxID=2011161 RepID=A0A914URG0_9BILA
MDDPLATRPALDSAHHYFPWVLLKILFYAFTYRAIHYFLVLRQSREKNYGQNDADGRKSWRIANETTSIIHSIVSGSWALSSLIKYPRMWTDMIEWYDDSTYSLVLMYVGYLLNDIVDMLINERSSRVSELLIHHVTAFAAFGCSVYTKRFVALCACALLMEVNSVFLHARSVMNMRAYDKTSPVYKAVVCANIITFVIFRLGATAYMSLWVWRVRNIVETLYVTVGLFGSITLTIMNAFLFYRLLRTDYLIFRKPTTCTE